MSSPPTEPAGSPPAATPAAGRPRRRWQVGLRTLFLLTAAIAVWLTHAINRRENATLEERIATMRPLARELVIDDPGQAAVVRLQELWYDENRWDLHLPPGRYRLCLATREVAQQGLAPVVQGAPIGAGRHQVALEQGKDESDWTLTATCDGIPLLQVKEPRGWNDGHGSMGGSQFSASAQQPADRPLVLFRRIFSKPDDKGQRGTPAGPSEGILLWIEPDARPESAR